MRAAGVEGEVGKGIAVVVDAVVADVGGGALGGVGGVRAAEVEGATHLRYEPATLSRSRIKRLRAIETPQGRRRVGELRVFYDVTGQTVEVLAIVPKRRGGAWLAEHATRAPDGDAGGTAE